MLPGGSGYGHGPHHEIPLLIQDRSFNADGSLFYPDTRAFFDGFTGPYLPRSDVPPIWNPEVFGNTIMVNGRTWPYLDIEPRRYRLRFVNGCNARFLILKLATNALAARPAPAVLPFWQIGADGGFLAKPVSLHQLLLGPSERADVIVDFTGMKPGTTLHLINEGPDEPFGGGIAGLDFPAADRRTTGQVLRLRVVPRSSSDRSVDPAHLQLPAVAPLGEARHVRRVSLNEAASTLFDGPVAGLLGTLDAASNPVTQTWMDPVTETPLVNRTELWEIHNFTEDAHPIHIHQVQFQVVDRQDGSGRRRAPEAWETGYKDTLIAYPDEVTRFKVRFDLPGLYVWHCHILEHEDREMMRPLLVRTR
jgi:bilirubin oxidase